MWARAALNRSLAIAEEHGDAVEQVRLLGPLHMFHLRGGDFKAALHYARRCSAIAETLGDPVATALAHSILGISLHLTGDLSGARARARGGARTLARLPTGQYDLSRLRLQQSGRDPRQGPCGCRAIRLRLWSARARPVGDAARMDHPISLTIVLHLGRLSVPLDRRSSERRRTH